jgi:hypothetical protein
VGLVEQILVAQASACVVLICGTPKSKEHRLKPVLLKTDRRGMQEGTVACSGNGC